MKIQPNLHPDEWKSGTEAIALCMICGGEYAPGTQECPDCHVSLSVVRRCPSCLKIVSAQHKKCVYCHVPFTTELPRALPDLPALNETGVSAGVRRFRAAVVSISTFLIVFCLGMFFLWRINRPAFIPQVIAKAHMIHSTQLRRTPSSNSSNLGKMSSGNPVNLTGIQENDQGRWVAVDWSGMTAYVPAADISAPRAVESDAGANALQFYLAGMETAEAATDGGSAVEEYAKTFPGDQHADELRWLLAERLRLLAQRGGSQGAEFRRQANQQMEQLAAGRGSFAEKARVALERTPSDAHRLARPTIGIPKKDEIQIIGGAGTQTSTAQSTPRNVLVLTQAEIPVRTGKLSQVPAGALISGHVTSSVKTNGLVAIPAGAACQLAVVSVAPSTAKLALKLISIDIDRHTYAVKSGPVEVRTGKGEAALSFRLDAPLVIQR